MRCPARSLRSSCPTVRDGVGQAGEAELQLLACSMSTLTFWLVRPAEDVLPAVVDAAAVVLLVPVRSLIWPLRVTALSAVRNSATESTHTWSARRSSSTPSQGANGESGLTSSRSTRSGPRPRVVRQAGPALPVRERGSTRVARSDGGCRSTLRPRRSGRWAPSSDSAKLRSTRSAAPSHSASVVAHLDQLAGEGQFVGIDVEVRAELIPKLEAAAGEVALARLETSQLVIDGLARRRSVNGVRGAAR